MAWEENVLERKVTWRELWKWTTSRTSFLIKSTYDVLPSPVNLVRWGKEEDDKCRCGETGTMKHILSSCQLALGRYTWRHNQVLKVFHKAAQEQAEKQLYNPHPKAARGTIDFLPAGMPPPYQEGKRVKSQDSGEGYGQWVVMTSEKYFLNGS